MPPSVTLLPEEGYTLTLAYEGFDRDSRSHSWRARCQVSLYHAGRLVYGPAPYWPTPFARWDSPASLADLVVLLLARPDDDDDALLSHATMQALWRDEDRSIIWRETLGLPCE